MGRVIWVTLPPTNMEPDRGVLEDNFPFKGTGSLSRSMLIGRGVPFSEASSPFSEVPDAPPVRDCSPLSGEHDERKDELQDELLGQSSLKQRPNPGYQRVIWLLSKLFWDPIFGFSVHHPF